MQARALLRGVFVVPPALLLAAGLNLVVASIRAWGIGADGGYQAWTSTLIGLSFAVAVVIIGAVATREVVLRTLQGGLRAGRLQVGLGLTLLIGGAFLVNRIASRVDKGFTFGFGSSYLGSTGFLFFTLLGLVIMIGCLACVALLYCNGIEADGHFCAGREEAAPVEGTLSRPPSHGVGLIH